jgi:hypothetical protein
MNFVDGIKGQAIPKFPYLNPNLAPNSPSPLGLDILNKPE